MMILYILLLTCCLAANIQSAIVAAIDRQWTWVSVNAALGLGTLIALAYCVFS